MKYDDAAIFRSIKTWAEGDRPREKFLLRGAKSLSDSELLAILIGTGHGRETALDLARRVLQDNANELSRLGQKSVAELTSLKGIGQVKAITILAALELGLRRNAANPEKRTKISSSLDAFQLLNPYLAGLNHEEFYVMFLNRGNLVIHIAQISRGGIHSTSVDARIIFRLALQWGACAIILAHNHPSGSTTPSDQDISLTRQIADGGKLIQISIYDHLIIGDQGYFSFADSGMM